MSIPNPVNGTFELIDIPIIILASLIVILATYGIYYTYWYLKCLRTEHRNRKSRK